MNQSKIIGLAGTAGAGKDTAAELLCTLFNMQNLSTGDALRAITRYLYRLDSMHNPIRDQLFEVATYIRSEIDAAALVKLCILQAQALQLNRTIISGLRSVGEAEAVRQAGGIIVGIDADAHIRYDRMFARARDAESQKTLDEFLAQDEIENRGVSDSGPGRGIRSIIDGADVLITNNDDLNNLRLELKNKVAPLL